MGRERSTKLKTRVGRGRGKSVGGWLGILAIALLPCTLQAETPPRSFQQTRTLMGVPFTIAFYAEDPDLASRAFDAAFARIAELDAILSDYQESSESRKLAASAPHPRPMAISDDLRHVISESLRCSRQTGGAFDVTVGPLTQLWRRSRRQGKRPAPDQLQAARRAVGYDKIELTADGLRLLAPNMRLDFGGIGQGYAADESLKTLASLGIRRALVNASGDVVAAEPPPGEIGWKVALTGLVPAQARPAEFIYLARAALVTSGDAFQFVEIDGQRYSHLVDVKTGLGSSVRGASIVFAPRGAIADAWATALCLLPPQEGLRRLAQSHPEASAILVRVEDSGETHFLAPRFPERRPIPPSAAIP